MDPSAKKLEIMQPYCSEMNGGKELPPLPAWQPHPKQMSATFPPPLIPIPHNYGKLTTMGKKTPQRTTCETPAPRESVIKSANDRVLFVRGGQATFDATSLKPGLAPSPASTPTPTSSTATTLCYNPISPLLTPSSPPIPFSIDDYSARSFPTPISHSQLCYSPASPMFTPSSSPVPFTYPVPIDYSTRAPDSQYSVYTSDSPPILPVSSPSYAHLLRATRENNEPNQPSSPMGRLKEEITKLACSEDFSENEDDDDRSSVMSLILSEGEFSEVISHHFVEIGQAFATKIQSEITKHMRKNRVQHRRWQRKERRRHRKWIRRWGQNIRKSLAECGLIIDEIEDHNMEED